MLRALLVAAVLLAAAGPAGARAQEDDAPLPPGCERGPGTDADYAYCPDLCPEDSDDADYAYGGCPRNALPGGGGGAPSKKRGPAAAVRPLAVQALPMTGGDPLGIAAAGAGFLLLGGGLRLRLT